jgi:phage FluMu protein gp41
MPQFKSSDTVKPSLDVTNTDAEALDVTGGAEFGSGNVELIGIDGKINGPLSTTIIDDLSGANLTTLNASNVSSGTLAAARLPAKVTVTSGDADALDVTGGLTIGSGDVALIGVDGKISGPLSSTIIDDLSGANLTTLAAGNISSGTVATARLGTGTASSSTFLRGDGAWEAIAAGGKVLQVVTATYATQTTSTSATPAASGLTVDITPATTDSKVLIIGSVNGCRKDGSTGLGLLLTKDGAAFLTFEALGGYDGGAGTNMVGGVGFAYLHSPSSTSACTYAVTFKNTLAAGTVYVQGSSAVSQIAVLEIA